MSDLINKLENYIKSNNNNTVSKIDELLETANTLKRRFQLNVKKLYRLLCELDLNDLKVVTSGERVLKISLIRGNGSGKASLLYSICDEIQLDCICYDIEVMNKYNNLKGLFHTRGITDKLNDLLDSRPSTLFTLYENDDIAKKITGYIGHTYNGECVLVLTIDDNKEKSVVNKLLSSVEREEVCNERPISYNENRGRFES